MVTACLAAPEGCGWVALSLSRDVPAPLPAAGRRRCSATCVAFVAPRPEGCSAAMWDEGSGAARADPLCDGQAPGQTGTGCCPAVR